MRTLEEELEVIKDDNTKIGIKPPKVQSLSDVSNTTYFDVNDGIKNFAPALESDLGNRLSAGFDRGIQDLKNITEQMQIYGGQALMSIGGFFDSEKTVSMGRELIKSAYGELQADEKKYFESAIPMSDKDMESFGYGLGQGIANYGSMLAVGYVAPVAGIGLGTALEVGQKAEEKIGYHIEETGDSELNKYTSQKAQKDTLYTTIYGVGSAIIEKKFGLGEQLKLVKMPITSKLKHVIKTAVSEGGTETLQELFATGLDWRGGYIDSSKLPERFMGALKEGAIGAVLGGGMGVASAINHRSQAKAILREQLKNTVPEKDLDNVVDGIYESANDSMTSVVAQELIQSESLRNKHGALYNQILQEINKQIEDVGAFSQYTEAQRSQYAITTAKMFADQVLGEANKRGVVIDEVVKASEVVYKDGRLYLQGASKKTKLKRLKEKKPSLLQFIRSKGGVIDEGGELKMMDASKQYIGLVNKNGVDLDTMGEALWEAGYFTERPTVAELLDLIDSELRGTKHYPLGYVEQKGVSQAENEAMLDNAISEYAEIMEYDISKMSFEEKQQIYDQMQRNLFASEEPIVEGEEVVEDFGFTDNEFFQVADEMARLDDIHPEYKGETININGVEKTVYNSNGDRIAMSEPALQNFYNWFGNSKVIDEQGRPLVVYHGTATSDIKIFNTKKAQDKMGRKLGLGFGKGKFYFTTSKKGALQAAEAAKNRGEGKTPLAMPLYLRIENPISADEYMEKFKEISNGKEIYSSYENEYNQKQRDSFISKLDKEIKKEGYDGIIDNISGQISVFNPNQIKSTSNRGTYSESDNIYLQTAFHGTGALKLEGGKFSLSKIGTGEGHQAHGYGIYATVEYDVADKKYRKMIADAVYGEQADFFNEERLLDEYNKQESVASKSKKQQDWDKLAFLEELLTRHEETTLLEEGEYSDDIVDWYNRNIREKVINKDRKQGQVFELDVPENDFLINEQLKYENQPNVVKQALDNIFESADSNYPNKDAVLKKYKDRVGASLYNLVAEVEYFNKHKTLEGELASNSDAFKLASDKLNSLGVKGITYDGREDGRSFVIFNPNDIEVIQNFYQVTNLPKQEKKVKGSFDALTKAIKITSEADFSTYSHEFAHFWLDNIWNYVNSGMASEKYIKEFEAIKKWLGTKGNYPTRSQHEKFARAYEKYLYKGTNADAPIGQAFKDYENFIREVYSSITEIDTRAGLKKYRAVPKLVYDFFNNMTSGTLPFYGDIEEPEKEVKKEVKEVKEFVAEETKILEENRANYNLKPVETDIKKSYLTAYFKMTGEEVEAGTTTHEYQEKRAMSFIESDLARADRIAEGKELLPDDILDTAFNIMYARVQKRLGNRDKYAKALLNASMELRRYGQEIEATKLAYQDEKESAYWINKVMTSKAEALADSNSLKLKDMNAKIEKTIKSGMKEGKSAKDIAKELRSELGVTELFQEEVYPTEDTDIKSYNYIYKYVNEQLGLGMSMEEAETITRKADDMLASLENSMSKTGNPSVDFFVKQKDLENYANSLAPSSNARVIVSVVGRGNLLTSIKSPLTNIISNFFVGAYRGAVRRVNLGVANSIVSPELIKENKMYSWEIFRKTGYNVNNITPETPRNTILGEKLTHSEGEGNIRKLGRLYEEYIYKWSLGAGDVLFKDYAFTDYVALKATKLANGDVNKANALFKDASLIEPQTEEGKQIRQEAIDESLIATFQNKGAISEGALKARASIDFGVGFGEIIAPFVKTPANIVSMGLKAGFGGVRAIASEIKRDVKAGKILKPTQENIDLVVQNGLGLLLASMLINAIDDDDYMPPYALATSKDKQLAKELNIPFNAVKIGDTWVSLDYLGALASPLVGLLQARREEGFLNNIYGYSKSAGVQALSIPAFGNISDLFEKVQNLVRKSGDEVMSETGQDLLEQAYARVVPSIVSDVAKALDPYERETQGNEFITKIPVLRETAPKKVSVTSGEAEELGSPIYDLLFGSRVKEQVTNDVADELQRLNNAGYGVGLTTVTRSGLLSELDEDTKQKVREDFAEEYSKQVKRLIKTSRYKRLSDEDKMESVNKIRRSIIEKLKKRYLKKRKK